VVDHFGRKCEQAAPDGGPALPGGRRLCRRPAPAAAAQPEQDGARGEQPRRHRQPTHPAGGAGGAGRRRSSQARARASSSKSSKLSKRASPSTTLAIPRMKPLAPNSASFWSGYFFIVRNTKNPAAGVPFDIADMFIKIRKPS